MAARDSFGSQIALLAFVAITATSASSWYWGGSHEPQKPVGAVVQKSDANARLVENSPTVAPSPILRPLALLANAIGSEPLFVLKTPGTPALSESFRPAPGSSGCPKGSIANPLLLDTGQDACAIVAAMRRKLGDLKVKIVVATLPDWVDSSLQWTFDPMLDAIQMSAAQMGYVLMGFDMADSDPDPSTVMPKGSVWPYPRVHELTPGSLLFRRPKDVPSSDPDFLLILLVGETATAGVHSAAFAAALDLALLWEWPSAGADGVKDATHSDRVGILGPTYSGSTFSMVRGLNDAAERHGIAGAGTQVFDVVTGSATNPDNPKLFMDAPSTSFRAVTRSDREELSAIGRFLGDRNPGWTCGNDMALLVEANTTWGRGLVDTLARNPESCRQCKRGQPNTGDILLPCATVVPFPLHISRLRSASPTMGEAGNVPSHSAVPLDLSERSQPVDLIPPESPQLTAATVEMMMGGMFRAVQDRHITAIGILATDKRDHLYLAEEIARHRPNVLAFTLENSLVYLHPDVAGFVRGTLVASTYSLSERTQRLTRPLLGERLPQQFGSSPAHGVFNALAVLMGHPAQLIDYDVPAGLGGGSSQEAVDSPCRPGGNGGADGGCSPPVWISVVGRNELLPLDAEPGAPCVSSTKPGAGYALCAGSPSVSGVSVSPTPATAAITAALSCATGAESHCGERVAYLSSHHIFLLAVGLLFIAMMSYQVWLQRRIDLYNAAREKSSGSSSIQEQWLKAILNLVRDQGRQSRSSHPARAEFMASIAAIRGASIALFLWWTKLAAIYLADRFDLTSPHVQWVFVPVALAASLYVVWQTVNAFWFIGDGSLLDFVANRAVITLLLALAVVASVGNASDLRLDSGFGSIIIAFGLVLGGLSIFVNPTGGSGVAASTLTRWRRLPALLALGAFIALSMDLMFMNWGSVSAPMYADRTASLDDLVSPASPILLFVITLFWWGAWNVRRLQLLNLPEGEIGIGMFLVERARAAGVDPELFRQPTLTLGGYLVVPTVAALVALGFGHRYVGTIDGRYFGEFLLLGAAAIATVMLHALAHAMHLGRALESLLKALSRHPGAPMFRVLGKEPVRWRITFRESTRPDLEVLCRHIARLDSALDSWGPPDSRLLPGIRQAKTYLKYLCRSALCRLNARGTQAVMVCPLDADDWRALNRLTQVLNRILQVSLWSPNRDRLPVSTSLIRSLGEMEYIVLFHASIVVRDLMMRLVSGFTMVLGGTLMLVAAHLLYTFEGRVFWLTFDAAAMAFSATLALRLLLTFERDPILSALWATAPGKISLFGGLTWRMVTYAAISLASLFAVFFPELGGHVLNWVAPARAVLSE